MIITTKSNIRIYDTGHRGDCRTESCEQIDCMGWLEKSHPERFALAFHVANETKAHASYMLRRRKEGVKPGVSDIIQMGIPPGAFELKRLDRTKSKVSAEQMAFLEAHAAIGGFSAICYGAEAFKVAYADYLKFCDGVLT